MQSNTSDTTLRYFVPIFGSYYHFFCESALGVYNLLEQRSLLSSRNIKLWYQGSYGEALQLFSRYPIDHLPIVKPYLLNASTIGSDIETLTHVRLKTREDFYKLRPMVNYLGNSVPFTESTLGITIIKRAHKRMYLETEDLAEMLQRLGFPIRVVQLELVPFAAQVNIMRSTRVLIAPHGAGTINQVFMPRGGEVIELCPMGCSNWHAKAVADVFGHGHTELASEHPGVFGRQPSDAIKKEIEEHWGPHGNNYQPAKKHSRDFNRARRDVRSFSIKPSRVMEILDAIFHKRYTPDVSGDE